MRALIALSDDEKTRQIQDALAGRDDVEVKTVQTTGDVRELFGSWVPDIVFADPSTMLGSGPFSGTRAVDRQKPVESADMLSKTGILRYFQSVNPKINLIFVCDDFEYSSLGMSVRASGYLKTPLDAEAVCREIDSLRHEPSDPSVLESLTSGFARELAAKKGKEYVKSEQIARVVDTKSGLFIRTFGNFEAFFNGKPIEFKHGRTKELFAYLVDRNGSMVSNDELVAALWDDNRASQHASYLRTLKLDLEHTLQDLGCEEALTRGRGVMGCKPTEIKCDYFEYLRSGGMEVPGANRQFTFRGEYMSQYPWAEATKAGFGKAQ